MRIFVGGLPRAATKDDVVRLFKQFGADDDNVVLPRDRRTRRRKGVAYIELADGERARAAIALFAGFEIEGKALTVCAAADRPVRRPRRKLSILALMCAAGLSGVSSARADQQVLDAGLTLNPILGGVHESFNDREHVPPIPIPLLLVRFFKGPFEVDLEGLPPLGAVHADDAIQGPTATSLSIFDGIARVWDPLRRFSVGVGQTLYNQSTHYTNSVEIHGIGETQFSRVTGVTYQLGYGVPFRRGRFEATVQYSPAMLGTQYSIYDDPRYFRRADPERAEQIDTAIRYERPAGPHAVILFGMRYLNYTAHYSEVRGGGLSDRNVGLLAVAGYRVRIGR